MLLAISWCITGFLLGFATGCIACYKDKNKNKEDN